MIRHKIRLTNYLIQFHLIQVVQGEVSDHLISEYLERHMFLSGFKYLNTWGDGHYFVI